VSLPAKRLSIRKVREVLRLKYGIGMGSRQIAKSCSMSHATVHDYLKRTESFQVQRRGAIGRVHGRVAARQAPD
jgi:transposase